MSDETKDNPLKDILLQETLHDTRDLMFLLHCLALEWKRPWWKRLFKRWVMSDEPLRHDAARLLRRLKYSRVLHADQRYVGSPD